MPKGKRGFQPGVSGNPKGRPEGALGKKKLIKQEDLDEDMRRLGPKVVQKFTTMLNSKEIKDSDLIKLLCYISDYNKNSDAIKKAEKDIKKKLEEKDKESQSIPEEGNVTPLFSTKAIK